jgi:aspartyl-tRNA(Asn)/glutamyl-tRNA(Gln) amidotransferase subunit B
VKNLNSFRAVERAIEYEYQRQVALLEAGEKVVQETRGWDDSKQKTFSQRKKEDSHDYRYFPDPDLPKLKISELSEFAEKELRKEMSELPEEKRGRYAKDYGIKEEDIEVFINSKLLSEMFDKFVAPKLKGDKNLIKIASNYITNDLKKLIEGRHEKIEIIQENFYELPIMIGAGEISSRGAKDILAEFVEKGGSPKVIAKEKNLIQKSDENELQKVVEEIIKNNPKVVQDFKGGKEASLQFLVGQGMKATKGAGNPEVIKKMLKEKIREN